MLVAAIIFLLPIMGIHALTAGDQVELRSRAAVLLDATTGTVLYEKEGSLEIPPASLTKLMTMHVVLEEVKAGRVSLDDMVALPRSSWAINQSWGSSLMFLAPGQQVTLRELMLGLAVSSGNDAAVAVALHLAPSIRDFVDRMNQEARSMGLSATRFVEPSGISELNMTTAADFASFCRSYLEKHPQALAEFHSVREFAYPKPENLPEVFRDRPGTIVQYNRNLLLDALEGVDGLKTGYIIESGYNIALTAERSGTRLIAVLLGGPGSGSAQGGRFRAEDGGKLLAWGFENFKTLRPVVERLEPVRVWKGRADYADIAPAEEMAFTVPAGRGNRVSWVVVREDPVLAPISTGAVLGELVISDESGELRRIPLAAVMEIAEGGVFKRMRDTLILFFRGLFSGGIFTSRAR